MKLKRLLRFYVTLLLIAVASGSAWAAEKTITLTQSSFTSITNSYADCTATVDGIGFTVSKGYKASKNNVAVIQMNNNTNGGDGILYNTTAISGLKSIQITLSEDASKAYTITTGSTEKPTTNSGTNTKSATFNAQSGDTHFQLKVNGATYISSIVITYDDDNGGSTTTKQSAGLAFSATTATATIGEAFTAPTLTNPNNLDVTYSSSNEDVATVATDGTVTLKAKGTTTIKATSEETDDYYAGSAQYTLTVKEVAQVVDGYFNFEGKELDYGSGVTTTTDGNTYITEAKTWTAGNVTLVTNGKYRWWQNDGTMRFYRNTPSSTMTISVPAGKVITEVKITGGQQWSANVGTYTSSNGKWEGSAQEVVFTYAAPSGSINVKTVTVTYADGTAKQSAGLSFPQASYTANLGETFTAPTLTNPNSLTVSYSSSNEDVATVDATSGDVTLKAAGTTIITATFDGNDDYEAGNAQYTLTVVDPNAPGTQNNPYTVAQALAFIETLGTATSSEVYVKGVVSSVTEVSTQYKNATYIIKDADVENALTVYRGKYLDNTDFTSEDQIKVNDEVLICGKLKLYNTTPEFDTGNYIVTLTRPQKEAGLAYATATVEKTYGDEAFTNELTNENNLTVSYTSSEPTVATVAEDGKVTILKAGTTVITATSAETEAFKAGEASYTLTVKKAAAGLAFSAEIASATIGSEFTAPTLSNDNNLTVAYASSKTDVAEVNAETGAVTLKGKGETIITASTDGDDNHEAGTATYTLTVSKAAIAVPTFSITGGEVKYNTAVTITAAEGLNVVYTTDGSNPAEMGDAAKVSENNVATVSITKGVTIKAVAMDEDMDASTLVEYTFTVAKPAAPTFSPAAGEVAYNTEVTISKEHDDFLIYYTTDGTEPAMDASYEPAGTTKSYEGAIKITDDNVTIKALVFDMENAQSSEVASATYTLPAVTLLPTFSPASGSEVEYGNTVTITAEGASMIIYTTDGTEPSYKNNVGKTYDNPIAITANVTIKAVAVDDDGREGQVATATYTMVKKSHTVAFAETNVTKTYSTEKFTNTVNKPEGLTLAYTSSAPEVATVDAETGEVTLLKAGTATITAAWEATASHEAGSVSYTLNVEKATVTLTFADESKTAKVGETVTNALTVAPEGMTVGYTTSDANIAAVAEDGTVTAKAAGTATITATFAETEQYKGATASYTVSISKNAVALSFYESAYNATYGEDFTAPAVNSDVEGLTISYSSSATDVAEVDANTGAVTLKKAGQTTITASFAGNDTYAAATAQYTLTVNKGTVTLAFADATVEKNLSDEAFTNELTNDKNLAVSYSSSDENVATVDNDGEVTILAVGTTTITATFAGNEQYNGTTATYTLTVSVAETTLSELTDNSTWINDNNGKVANVTLTRTFRANAYNTIALPFDVNETMLKAVFSADVEVAALTSSTYTDKKLDLDFSKAIEIKAGKPYLIYVGKDNNVVNPTFNGVKISSETETTETTYADFVPVINLTEKEASMSTMFLGAGNTLYYVSEASTINGFRAYFSLKNVDTTGLSSTINVGGTPTGITTINNEQLTIGNDGWYTLDGSKLNAQPTQKGIYLHNGKKVVVK